MKVLHLSMRLVAGVRTVLQHYVQATPDIEHVLLCPETDRHLVDQELDGFSRILFLPSGRRDLLVSLRCAVREERPDIVHAHASTGGALARLALPDIPIVYTPHAFSTLAPITTKVGLLGRAERLLGLRPVVVAGVSNDECERARRLSPRSQTYLVRNRPSCTELSVQFSSEPTVCMSGRLTPQKDPRFFAEVARLLAGRMNLRWVGDGDPAQRLCLEDAGVAVTGWLPHEGTLAAMSECQVYLHTALYEGSSLALLDASAMGMPVLGRAVPGVAEVPWLLRVDDPHMAAEVLASLMVQEAWQVAAAASLAGVAELTTSSQRRELLQVYARASRS